MPAMPTLPMYLEQWGNRIGASHAVRSPGGYEWWRVDFESPDVRLIAQFTWGGPFDGAFIRQYEKYLARPTHNVPPRAMEFVSFRLFVKIGERIAIACDERMPVDMAASSEEHLDVRIGDNRLWRDSAGVLQVTVNWRDISAQVTSEPLLAFTQELVAADHHWVLSDPVCRANGRITAGGESIGFTGLAFPSHHYGTSPPGWRCRRWFSARALFDNRLVAIRRVPSGLQWIEVTPEGLTVEDFSDAAIVDEQSVGGRRCPSRIVLGTRAELTRPRPIGQTPSEMVVEFDLKTPDGTTTALAAVEMY
jgi:hypothetical protein